jgi:hypothetical protein
MAGNQTVEGFNLARTWKKLKLFLSKMGRKGGGKQFPINLPTSGRTATWRSLSQQVPSTALPRKHLTNAKKRVFRQGVLERGEST